MERKVESDRAISQSAWENSPVVSDTARQRGGAGADCAAVLQFTGRWSQRYQVGRLAYGMGLAGRGRAYCWSWLVY